MTKEQSYEMIKAVLKHDNKRARESTWWSGVVVLGLLAFSFLAAISTTIIVVFLMLDITAALIFFYFNSTRVYTTDLLKEIDIREKDV